MFYPFSNQETQYCQRMIRFDCEPILNTNQIKILTPRDSVRFANIISRITKKTAVYENGAYVFVGLPKEYDKMKAVGLVNKIYVKDGVAGFETDVKLDKDKYKFMASYIKYGSDNDLDKIKEGPLFFFAIGLAEK